MKRLISILVIFLFTLSAFGSDSLTVFYRIRLDQDIDPSSQRLVTLGLEKAREANADYILLDLDTYGGAVNAADSIRSAILRFEKPVLAFVNMHKGQHGDFALQWGFYNQSAENGVQIGVLNNGQNNATFQLGLININKNGLLPVMIFVNFGKDLFD